MPPALQPQPVTRVHTMPQVSAAQRLLHTVSGSIPVALAPLPVLPVSIAVAPVSIPVAPVYPAIALVSLPTALAPLLIAPAPLLIAPAPRHTVPVLHIAPVLRISMYQAGPTMGKNSTSILPGPRR